MIAVEKKCSEHPKWFALYKDNIMFLSAHFISQIYLSAQVIYSLPVLKPYLTFEDNRIKVLWWYAT